MAQKQTALKAAMNGEAEKLSDKQTKGALSQAIGKLTNLTKRAETSKEAVINTGTSLMHSAETLGSLFLSSMAEGYVGPDKLKLGGVDLRAPAGLLAQGYGLYQILSGESGGAHALALGNGVTGSWMASVAVDAGRALRERRSGGAPPVNPGGSPATSFRGEGPMVHVPALEGAPAYGAHYLPAGSLAPGYAQMNLIPEPTMRVAGPVREIMLTPEAESRTEAEIAGPRHRMRRAGLRRGAENRFPRANAAEEAPEAE